MEKPPRLYEVLYVSTLAPDAPLKVVSTIANAARSSNAARAITGLLVFDGMRFCQYLEGEQKPLLALIERIRLDARHVNLEILHHGPVTERRFKNFGLAYAPVDDVELLAQLENADGQEALRQFSVLIESLDMHG